MTPYSFVVSLRAEHPTRDLAFLSALLAIAPHYGWAKGDERLTPQGKSLGEQRSQSYWSARITAQETSSDDERLDDFLNKSLDELEAHKSELQAFIASGGSVNYFVSLFGAQNFGLTFAPALLQRLASAGIELQLDVFPAPTERCATKDE